MTEPQDATNGPSGQNRIDRRSFLARSAITGASLAAVGIGGSLLDACGSSSSSSSGSSGTPTGTHPNGISTSTPKTGGKLIFGTEAEEVGFSTTKGTFDTTGILYARTVFDPLAILSAQSTVEPYLAQSITPNANYTTWTITTRPGVMFHNNTPCDANAIAANFKAQIAATLTGPAVTNIASVAATNPTTVVVTMKSPWVTFDYYLTGGIGGQIAFIAEPNWLATGQQSHPVGTGPFIFQEWQPNDHFTATRNPNYWRKGLPYLDSITYRPIPDTQAQLNSLLSGTIDIMHTSSPVAIGPLRANTSLPYVDDSGALAGEPDMGCVLLNLSKAPFDNLKVRQAAAMAISSSQYCKVIAKGISIPTNQPFAKGSPFYTDNNPYPAYNPTMAKNLISEVAKETGQPVKFVLTHVSSPTTATIAEYLQQQFTQIGMQVTLNPILQDSIIDTALLGKYEACVWRQFGAVNPDMNYIFWSPTNINPVFSINMARNSDPNMQTALEEGRTATTTAGQNSAYQKVSNLMGTDIPYLWTDRTVWAVASQPKVENFNGPTTPSGAKAYGMISGAVWPTEIWLNG